MCATVGQKNISSLTSLTYITLNKIYQFKIKKKYVALAVLHTFEKFSLLLVLSSIIYLFFFLETP